MALPKEVLDQITETLAACRPPDYPARQITIENPSNAVMRIISASANKRLDNQAIYNLYSLTMAFADELIDREAKVAVNPIHKLLTAYILGLESPKSE
jgi:hypothetical protein